jgi:hypothetical protein
MIKKSTIKKSRKSAAGIKEKVSSLEKMNARRKTQYEIYEHLEHYLKKTTYADRWRWLKSANAFVEAVEKQRKKGKLFVGENRK